MSCPKEAPRPQLPLPSVDALSLQIVIYPPTHVTTATYLLGLALPYPHLSIQPNLLSLRVLTLLPTAMASLLRQPRGMPVVPLLNAYQRTRSTKAETLARPLGLQSLATVLQQVAVLQHWQTHLYSHPTCKRLATELFQARQSCQLTLWIRQTPLKAILALPWYINQAYHHLNAVYRSTL